MCVCVYTFFVAFKCQRTGLKLAAYHKALNSPTCQEAEASTFEQIHAKMSDKCVLLLLTPVSNHANSAKLTVFETSRLQYKSCTGRPVGQSE